jgi:hypothetical protein
MQKTALCFVEKRLGFGQPRQLLSETLFSPSLMSMNFVVALNAKNYEVLSHVIP